MSHTYRYPCWARVFFCVVLAAQAINVQADEPEKKPAKKPTDGNTPAGAPSEVHVWEFRLPPDYIPITLNLNSGFNFAGGSVGGGKRSRPASDANSAADPCHGPDDNSSAGNPAVSNPVILATGEKIQLEHDIVGNGLFESPRQL